jgi:hypothetical protein
MSTSSSWRPTGISSLKGFLHSTPSSNTANSLTRATNAVGATDERRQSWRAWAAQKIRSRMKSPQRNSNNEILTLFPGWAARKYPPRQGQDRDKPVPFEIEAFVSGYAITHRSREQASRSQRAFIRLAKGALPQLNPPSAPLTVTTQVSLPYLESQTNHLPRILPQRINFSTKSIFPKFRMNSECKS